MYYVIAEGRPASEGRPFYIYKFKTLKEAHQAKVADETSVVYSEKKQLTEFFRKEELDAVWLAINNGRKEFPFGTNGFPSATVAAEVLHALVLQKAVTVAATPQETPADPSPVRAMPRPKAQPRAEVEAPMAQNVGKIHGDEVIKVLKPFEGRSDKSLRSVNMAHIQASENTGEAIRRIEASGQTEKVAREFIRWGVKSGYIELVAKY